MTLGLLLLGELLFRSFYYQQQFLLFMFLSLITNDECILLFPCLEFYHPPKNWILKHLSFYVLNKVRSQSVYRIFKLFETSLKIFLIIELSSSELLKYNFSLLFFKIISSTSSNKTILGNMCSLENLSINSFYQQMPII